MDYVQSSKSHDACDVGLLRRIGIYAGVAKPGIIAGNLLTAAAGFFLATTGKIDFAHLSVTLLGLALIIAAASVFNNYGDRVADAKMARTRGRALAVGRISEGQALWFAFLLAILGTFVLALFTTRLALAMALVGLVVYVALYSPLKYRTHHATLVGSIAGSIPPLVGYCAASNRLDWGALALFFLVAFWQLPHFFAIAIRRLDDYRAASIPVLPVKRGVEATQRQMVLYIAAFLAVVPLLTLLGGAGYLYLAGTGVVGGIWLGLSIRGVVRRMGPSRWAKQMFFYSLGVIFALSLLLMIDGGG